MSTLVRGARLIDDGAVHEDAWVLVHDGRVTARGTGAPDVTADDVVDAREVAGQDAVLSPGFVDLHGHGGGGHAYDDGAEAIRAARVVHRAHGTTSAVVSLVSAPVDALLARLAAVRDVAAADDDVLGAHLEGPFLDPAHRGAHDPAVLRSPVDVAALLAAGGVRQITLAPELPGALEAIPAVVAAGAVAAIGHTGADAALSRRAFDAGARLLTHAFNAMPGLHHRAPGPVGAAASDPRVVLELIADGVHVAPEVVRIAFAVAPGRIALVTDAMAAAGADDGAYALGGLQVDVTAGVARLSDGTIAGSTLTQDRAVRTAVAAGVDPVEALRAVTATPARVVGAADRGHLAPSARGDLVLLDARLHVRAVWAAGIRVA
ncbi:amidohydrolase family protein [Microbacterium sp. 10M-3C3]|uniref:N-acetylglucosamine-6-phosphate deacetylase n=1 Tax=Microbacterium sp. 10M-3C3 TaxID=2483401 RepID=UPI000F634EDB|nr:amidohydrolase family protein [Microbacterium sp. 10M-3C3]